MNAGGLEPAADLMVPEMLEAVSDRGGGPGVEIDRIWGGTARGFAICCRWQKSPWRSRDQ